MVGLRLWGCSLIVLFIVISFCFVLNLFANLWFNLIALCSVYGLLLWFVLVDFALLWFTC